MIITSSEMIVYSETDSIFKIRGRGSKNEVNSINLFFNICIYFYYYCY